MPINDQGPLADVLRSIPMPSAFVASNVQDNVTGAPFVLETAFQPERQMDVTLVWARHDRHQADTKTTNTTAITRRFIG
jgi:hypothetical protein